MTDPKNRDLENVDKWWESPEYLPLIEEIKRRNAIGDMTPPDHSDEDEWPVI